MKKVYKYFYEGRWISRQRVWQLKKRKEGKYLICGEERNGNIYYHNACYCEKCRNKIKDRRSK